MKLEYKSIRDDSSFILTNFNCAPSQTLLSSKGLYKILWAKDSGGTLTIDGYKLRLKKSQVIFCTPLNILEVEESEGLLALVFNREFYCIRDHDAEVSCNGTLFLVSSQPPVVILSDLVDLKSFDAIFFMFKEEFETQDHIQGEVLRVLLKRLLIKSSRLIKVQSLAPVITSSQDDTLRQYHVVVEQHFREKHKVADYAALLFKSPKALSNLFKKTSKIAPLQVINNRLILEAKRLLLFSAKNVEEVAYEVGFKDAGHFSKFFKKQVGTPPGTLKKARYKRAFFKIITN